MDLDTFERTEALLWAIEDHDLMILQQEALMKYHEDRDHRIAKLLGDKGRELELHAIRENAIKWKAWIARSLNALEHNRLFLAKRLQSFREEG